MKKAVIIGAGPAGLTAAWELLDRTDIKPVVFEATGAIGGISQTVEHNGNRMDIGGHRFFSKSDRVMDWWRNIMPLQGAPSRDDRALGREVPLAGSVIQRPLRGEPAEVPAPDPERSDSVMLYRQRLSRIFYLRSFFSYPVSLSIQTMRNLGLVRMARIGFSYVWARLFPIRHEKSLEDFFINRFGRELYATFFKDYTEKVWGVPCDVIKPEWGAQRIKGLSITKAIVHAASQLARRRDRSIDQKGTETSLIEQFLYPKLGPGQMWEEVARQVADGGGEVHLHREVVGLVLRDGEVRAVRVRDPRSGETTEHDCDLVFSTMPIKDLVERVDGEVPGEVREVADGLMYRDFITVGLLLDKLLIRNETDRPTVGDIVPDNWIYIQERDVRLGRLQIFNNWSPYMVADPGQAWIGLEYFCNEGDDLWSKSDEDFAEFAIAELAKIDICDPADVRDSVVIRMPKTYPAYFGTYDRFDELRRWTDGVGNLFLIGRNGMHRYNNQDHSMLTAMTAVDNIVAGVTDRANLWDVNAEEEYHEEK